MQNLPFTLHHEIMRKGRIDMHPDLHPAAVRSRRVGLDGTSHDLSGQVFRPTDILGIVLIHRHDDITVPHRASPLGSTTATQGHCKAKGCDFR